MYILISTQLINWPVSIEGPTHIQKANSGSIASLGRIECDVKSEEINIKAKFHVMSDLVSDCILGADLLQSCPALRLAHV